MFMFEDSDIENNDDDTIIYICIPDTDAITSNYSLHLISYFTHMKDVNVV